MVTADNMNNNNNNNKKDSNNNNTYMPIIEYVFLRDHVGYSRAYNVLIKNKPKTRVFKQEAEWSKKIFQTNQRRSCRLAYITV